MKVVVDTNVPKVANGQGASPQASGNCILTCAQKIEEIYEGKHVLVLDNQWHILNEYKQQLHSDGQPGVGDSFLKWVLTNYSNSQKCELVSLTEHPERGFEEFPDDPDLSGFDPSDRKFAAVSLAHPEHPPIFNAVDTDWWYYRDELRKHNVHVEFLCPELMTQFQAQKAKG